MRKLVITTITLAVMNCVAMGVEDGFQAPKVEGVNIPWAAIAIILAVLIGMVAATLKNPKRTQTELKVD